MSWHIVYLEFTSPTHFGSDERGIGVENVRTAFSADTLFSALCNAWARYQILTPAEMEGLRDRFNTEPPFLLSSAFPWVAGKIEAHYLPKPLVECQWLNEFPGEVYEKVLLKKTLKKAAYVPAPYFQHWLEPSESLLEDKVLDDIAAEMTGFQNETVTHIRPQHAQDRLTGASELYHLGQVSYNRDLSGLYFVVQLLDAAWENILNQALQALAVEGIGGERNFGLGRFAVDWSHGQLMDLADIDELQFIIPNSEAANGRLFCVLAPFHPMEAEYTVIQHDIACRYSLIRKKGWSFSHRTFHQMKKASVTVFGEGSVFTQQPRGEVLDIQPNDFPHPLYRYAKPLAVPLKPEGGAA